MGQTQETRHRTVSADMSSPQDAGFGIKDGQCSTSSIELSAQNQAKPSRQERVALERDATGEVRWNGTIFQCQFCVLHLWGSSSSYLKVD